MCIKINDINCNSKETIEELFNFYDEDLYRNTEENKEFEELIEQHALNGAVTDKRIFVFAFGLAIIFYVKIKNLKIS